MDDFARKVGAERLPFINEAAVKRDVTPVIIEKDFWVCWTLKRLTEATTLGRHLTFKGGTSLSKAYGIIERFSEDVDLTIARTAPLISEGASPMETGISGKERERRGKSLREAARHFVATIALPHLESAIETALKTHDGWEVLLDPEDNEGQTILFRYPALVSYVTSGAINSASLGATALNGSQESYIKPRIKLEFGARGEVEPSETKKISPYIAEVFPDEIPNATCTVPTLLVTRTFWEKATILHALHHGSKLREGMSRHYYDSFMLAKKGIAKTALETPALLEQVVRNKSVMFADSKASYETAKLGTLRLTPPEEVRAKLKSDYAAMAEMFMAVPPSFEELMVGIAKLESFLNGNES